MNAYLYQMKAVVCLLLTGFPLLIHAQNIEVGLAAGISTNSVPIGNMYYGFGKMTANYSGAILALYNFGNHLQIGAEARVMELSGISNQQFVGPYNNLIGGDNRRFVYAKPDISYCMLANTRVNLGKGYLYGGAAAGYGFAKDHDDKLSANEDYRAPGGGKGIVIGVQLGWVVGITGRLGAFIEASYRYIDLNYDVLASKTIPEEKLHYHISAYPVNIGLRYRILNTIIDNHYQHRRGDNESRER